MLRPGQDLGMGAIPTMKYTGILKLPLQDHNNQINA